MAAMESPPPQLKASGTLSEKEAQEVEVISKHGLQAIFTYADNILELLINSYFNITRKTLIDMVPKSIMYTLIQ